MLYGGWERVTSTCMGIASVADDAAILRGGERRDGTCRLKPVNKEFWCNDLIVKSSICPTWPMLLMRRVSWVKETPCPPTTVTDHSSKRECGRKVTSVSVGRLSLDDPLWSW